MAILLMSLVLIAWCFGVSLMSESCQYPPGTLRLYVKPLGEKERMSERVMFS